MFDNYGRDFVDRQNILNEWKEFTFDRTAVYIYEILKVLGLYPYKRIQNDMFVINWGSPMFYYSILVIFTLMASAVRFIADSYTLYNEGIYSYSQLFVACNVGVFVFTMAPYRLMKTRATLIWKWKKFEEKFHHFLVPRIGHRDATVYLFKRACLVFTVSSVFVTTFFASNINPYGWLVCFYYVIFVTVNMSVSFLFQYLLSRNADHLKNNMKTHIRDGSLTSVRLLEEYRHMWLALREAIDTVFAGNFTIPSIYFVAFNWLTVLSLYVRFIKSLTEYLADEDYVSIMTFLLASFVCVLNIFIVSNVGYYVETSCCDGFDDVILEFKERFYATETHNTVPIKMFLYTLRTCKPTFSVYGYFVMNRAFFVGLITNLVSYMVYLIQLSDRRNQNNNNNS